MYIFRSASQFSMENSSVAIKDYSSSEACEPTTDKTDNAINKFNEKNSGEKNSKESKELSPTKIQSNVMNSSYFSSSGTKKNIIARINEEFTVDLEEEEEEEDVL